MTAGGSSQVSDGAAALPLTTPEKAARAWPDATRAHRRAEGRRRGPGDDADRADPRDAAVLARAGLTIDEIDLFEVNEAFAPVVLAWEKELHPDMEPASTSTAARSRWAIRSGRAARG